MSAVAPASKAHMLRSTVLRLLVTLVRQFWLPALIVAGFLGIWQLYTVAFNIPRYVLPSVSQIFTAMDRDRDNLLAQTWVTLGEVALGLTIGVIAGLILATTMAYSRLLERGLYPLVIASQAVPVPTIASPLVIALGFNIWPRVVVIVLSVFFPVVVNVFAGLTSVDREQVNLMRSMSASGWQIFRHVRFPSALPLFFAGAKLAATYSVIGAVFGEWVGSDQGLGAYVLQQNATLRMDRAFAAIFLLSGLGILLFIVTSVIEHVCTPWRHRAVK